MIEFSMKQIAAWPLYAAALLLALLPVNMVQAQDQVISPAPPVRAMPAPADIVIADDAASDVDSGSDSLTEGYVLGPGDMIEVSVLGRPEYSARVQVQVDGTAQLPFLKSVPAAEKTVVELREDIASRLKSGGFYTDPVVAVAVVSYASRYVVVLGEVASPGLVPIDRKYALSEILARVGGVRSSASDEIMLRRENGEEIVLNIRDVATGTTEQDPFVKPGDKIYIDEAKKFYIYGQIAAPGTYKVQRDMTLRMAVAQGGGLTQLGSEKRIKIFRKGQELKKLDLSGQIQPDDVVVVGERFF